VIIITLLIFYLIELLAWIPLLAARQAPQKAAPPRQESQQTGTSLAALSHCQPTTKAPTGRVDRFRHAGARPAAGSAPRRQWGGWFRSR
jgi:hypothetical protein